MEKEDKCFLQEVYKGMVVTLEQKNDAYGNSYEKTFDKYGPVLLCARVDDKMSRYLTLSAAQIGGLDSVKEGDEKLEDTLKDVIGYASLELLRLHKTKAMAEETAKRAEAQRKRKKTLRRKAEATGTMGVLVSGIPEEDKQNG
jgi:hypothetical protein